MDWSNTKSIFIFVFLVLNIFLYHQYLNSYKEAQNVEETGEKDIEVRLKEDNITYNTLPTTIEKAAYVSGKVKKFNLGELPKNTNQSYKIEENMLVATLKEPVKLVAIDEQHLQEFLQLYVYQGDSYTLWINDEEEGSVLFFQRIMDNRTLYYNAFVKVYFNEEGEVYKYEQTMLEKLEQLDQQENLLTPIQTIQALYAKSLLKPDSRVINMKLGYSTLVQLTQTQVFVPTWEVRVRTSDGIFEEYFVNAVDGKIVDLQLEVKDLEEDE